MSDLVNEPPHYKAGEIECIDGIRSALTPEEFRGFCKGNMLKYTWREKHKGGNQDIEKARWYSEQLLAVPIQNNALRTEMERLADGIAALTSG